MGTSVLTQRGRVGREGRTERVRDRDREMEREKERERERESKKAQLVFAC